MLDMGFFISHDLAWIATSGSGSTLLVLKTYIVNDDLICLGTCLEDVL